MKHNRCNKFMRLFKTLSQLLIDWLNKIEHSLKLQDYSESDNH